jgi:hypothetical protein
MVCLIIAIPLKSFSQTCGPVLWGAGNGYPPGPYSSPDAACRILDGVTGPAEGWGPNAVYTDSDAAADEAAWEGTPTGGYPGSSTYCNHHWMRRELSECAGSHGRAALRLLEASDWPVPTRLNGE